MLFPMSFNISASLQISGYKNGCGLLEWVLVRLKIFSSFCLPIPYSPNKWNLMCIIIVNVNSLAMIFKAIHSRVYTLLYMIRVT